MEMDNDDLVQIEYWIEETAESGRYVRTDPMALAIAIRILSSDSMKGMFPRGVIASIDSEPSPEEYLMAEAKKYWSIANKRHYGAVQWIENSETGELLIYTRGEYRETLMKNIHSIEGGV